MHGIESWMITGVIAIASSVSTYAVLRSRVARIELDFKEHNEEDKLYHVDNERKMTAQFKRIDNISDKGLVLETRVNTMLSSETADEKFVSKAELNLHLKNIDTTMAHMSKSSDMIVGKLEELNKSFSTYMLAEINKHD